MTRSGAQDPAACQVSRRRSGHYGCPAASVELERPGSSIHDESLVAGIPKLATMTWYEFVKWPERLSQGENFLFKCCFEDDQSLSHPEQRKLAVIFCCYLLLFGRCPYQMARTSAADAGRSLFFHVYNSENSGG
jgi:hypothetical protein